MMARPGLVLSFLGRFTATIDGGTQLRVTSKKGIALLAYLAMHPDQAVSRERLATLLWGDRPDRQARLSLRQCIMSLRSAISPAAVDFLVLEDDTVALRGDQVSVDVTDFNALSQSGTLSDLERAALLYRGEFLCDLSVESEAFDGWARSVRMKLEATAASVLQACAERFDAADDGARAIEAAERLVAFDPLREDRQRYLLRIYLRHLGARAALAHGEALLNLLSSELDADPEPETIALIDEIRRDGVGQAGSLQVTQAEPHPAAAAELPASGNSESFARDNTRWAPRVETDRRSPPPTRGTRKWSSVAAFTVVLLALASLGQDQLQSTQAASMGIFSTPILVLPFRLLANGKEQAPMADAISNNLINALSVVGKFRVISNLTSRQYRGRADDIKAISRELGVRYVVDGNVQIEGDKLRVNVELVDASSPLQVWSDHFDGELAQSFSTDAVVQGIARALQVNIISLEGTNAAWQKSSRSGVNSLLSAGWASLLASGRENRLAESKLSFTEALRRDPESVSAMLGLAANHIAAVNELAVPTEPSLSEAEALLDKIKSREPKLSQAYFYRSLLQSARNKPQLALESAEQCLAINPSFAPGYVQVAALLNWLGRGDEALDRIHYAIRLSPKDPAMPIWYASAGWIELEQGHTTAAFDWLFRALALNPNSVIAHGALAAAYNMMGDRARADLHANRLRELTPGVSDERRLDRFGAHRSAGASRRVADSARLALAAAK